jgi:hypothetical protein
LTPRLLRIEPIKADAPMLGLSLPQPTVAAPGDTRTDRITRAIAELTAQDAKNDPSTH